ncbi:MAG: DUF3943 domain-containing protein [Candidatus Marinimicrobia bacterium]|nr:DUF3943 domain-containing protein [Candidatus Neomarinimicrobiota bacterium]
MMFFLKITLVLLISALSLFARVQSADSSMSHPHRIAFIHALAQPTFIWATNWYLFDQYWADISINTLQNNFETGWVWDEDPFDVNQVGHPTQGALVYTAARSQGLSYWQSLAYPTLASLIWEVGMENESPSVNDMITTPSSGVAFGEIMHRMSVLTLGEERVKPVWRQMLSGVINPGGYGLNRILFGTSIHRNYLYEQTPVMAGISLGAGPGFEDDSPENKTPRRFARFNIVYGNPFSKHNKFKPFDNFMFIAVLNIGREDYVGEIYTSGMVFRIYQYEGKQHKATVGIFQNYDFMNNDDYKVSSSSIGPGMMHDFTLNSNLSLRTQLATSFIFMGSAGDTSDELPEDGMEVRDYHFGPGFSGKLITRINWAERGDFYLRLKRYFIYVMGDDEIEGFENINILNMGFQARILKSYSLGGEYGKVGRSVTYRGDSWRDTLQTGTIYRFYLHYHIADTLFKKS